MDFAELKAQAAREIAAAFGVPHLLVVSGEATYSNRADARLELWEHTVIPLLDRQSSALSTWLGPMFGKDLRLAHDLDEIPALAPRRRLKWQQIQQADFLTLNEKRQALGYAPVAGGDGEGEQKSSEDFRRLHGYEQPRKPAGGQDGGRWSSSPESFVSLLQGRVIRSPGTRRPPVGRPGAGSGGQRGGDGGIPPRLPPRNPFPDKPECNEQWRRAVEDCKAEDDRMAAQPWSARSSRLFGYDFLDCLEIRISEACGGKPIGKKAMTGLKGACEMSSHPTSYRDSSLVNRAKDLSSAGDYEGAIEAYTLHLTQFPEDASALRWRAFALQQTERFAEAIVDLERSLCIVPGFPPAVFHRAEALAALGYYDEALDEFDRLEVAVPGYNTQTIAMFRAHCLIELGRYEEALANIRRLPEGRGIVGRERAALMERLPVDRRDAR